MTEMQPQMPQTPLERPQTSGHAIASLVCGIGTFVCGGVLAAIPAVITGHMALGRIKRAAGALGGRGMAIVGLVLGYLGIGLFIIMLLAIPFLLPAVHRATDLAKRQACKNNLKQIGVACHIYAAEHRGAFPERLSQLYEREMVPLDALVCPATDDKITSADEIDTKTSYVYKGAGLREGPTPLDTVVAHDKPENHDYKGRNVLYLDGTVRWEPADEPGRKRM